MYKTASLKCWDKAKKIRLAYYEDYKDAKQKGGIRWAGGAWSFSAVPEGLGDDVYSLTGEPYGASVAWQKDFALRCQEAIEAKGFARDLCSYMRNYLGSVVLNKYAFGGEFPKADFMWQAHICCSHAKWYQLAAELEGGVPFFCVDVSVGPYEELKEHRIEFVVNQLEEGIEWLEKVTGRTYDDKRLIEAVYNECRSTSLWAEICCLNQNKPAPLDEKTMYSLYVLGTLMKHKKIVADFYEELRDEVRERIKNGIAAIPDERCRVITDTQPPWAFLRIFRYLEKYGCVSVGSLYTYALIGAWEIENGNLVPRKTPQQKGIVLKDRRSALRQLVEWNLSKPEWQHFYNPAIKSDLMIKIVRQWKVDGVLLHYNRGCEGLSLGIAENRLALQKAGIPVMIFEGNMGDEREFDEARTISKIDAFMETLGLKKITG